MGCCLVDRGGEIGREREREQQQANYRSYHHRGSSSATATQPRCVQLVRVFKKVVNRLIA